MTIVQFDSEFILRLRPVVTLKKEFRMVQLLIEGELCCTRPDYETEKVFGLQNSLTGTAAVHTPRFFGR